MARVERGLNIVDQGGRSLLHVACLVVRPVLVMEEPAVLLAMVNSLAYRDAPPPGGEPPGPLSSCGCPPGARSRRSGAARTISRTSART
ncbi:hypothetical protein ACFQ0G_00100 [Streptomyces chiangmaiensis]